MWKSSLAQAWIRVPTQTNHHVERRAPAVSAEPRPLRSRVRPQGSSWPMPKLCDASHASLLSWDLPYRMDRLGGDSNRKAAGPCRCSSTRLPGLVRSAEWLRSMNGGSAIPFASDWPGNAWQFTRRPDTQCDSLIFLFPERPDGISGFAPCLNSPRVAAMGHVFLVVRNALRPIRDRSHSHC